MMDFLSFSGNLTPKNCQFDMFFYKTDLIFQNISGSKFDKLPAHLKHFSAAEGITTKASRYKGQRGIPWLQGS